MKRLIHNIKILGLRKGWIYWKMQNACLLNPEIALKWARNIRMSAITKSGSEAWQMIVFAEEIETSHRNFINERAI